MADSDSLHPEEEPAVADASPGRVAEFTAGRSCARRAMVQLGHAPGPVPRGPRREPVWPDGLVGSITHCPGYCAAVVADVGRWAAVGIDAEPARPLPERVRRTILVGNEPAHVARLDPAIAWDAVVFAAKEAVYKAWWPATRRWLGLRDAELTLDPATGRFRARLRVEPGAIGGRLRTHIDGRFALSGPLVLAAVAIGADPHGDHRVPGAAAHPVSSGTDR